MLNTLAFSPKQRLRSQAEYQHVFTHRSRIFGTHYLLYCRENNLSHGRIGIIASKKSVRFAVKRNKAKRQAREAFRLRQKALVGFDIVVIAQKKAATASKKELQACLNKLFTQLIKKHSACSSG